jgi:L-ribulose-5-phosphate 3-epimerase
MSSKVRNHFGVMQGRLLPKYQGRYQAHPVGYWKNEFQIAKNLGLDCIEFILDFNDSHHNPLLTHEGVDEILSISEKTGVSVKTVCADYFMEAPLHSSDPIESKKSQQILKKLLENSALLGVSDIVLPCVDHSSLNGEGEKALFESALSPLIPIAEEFGINFSLETDLSPISFHKLLERFDSKRVTVNYDIGNSASLCFNPIEELEAYGHRISDIHIKDRIIAGGPVLLGEGNANFSSFFKKLKDYNYNGPFIMQAYRDEEGIGIFKKQLNWIQEKINAFYLA